MDKSEEITSKKQQKYISNHTSDSSDAGNIAKTMIYNRKQVEDVLRFPNRIVGHVSVGLCRRNDEKRDIIGYNHGSGILIAPGIALTCIHTLFPKFQADMICQKSMRFSLAYHQYQGQEYTIEKVRYPQQYKELQKKDENEKYDFALLFLNKSTNHEQIPISFIWEQLTAKQYCQKHAIVSTYGYPGDSNAKVLTKLKKKINKQNLVGYQFQSQGFIFYQEQDDPYFHHNMLSEQGQSGSPIFVHDNKTMKLIGIHKGENIFKSICFGIPLWFMKGYIKRWLQEEQRSDLLLQLQL